MWVARDKNGKLHIFDRKPWRDHMMYGEPASFWSNNSQATSIDDKATRERFQFLTWEDEPIEVNILTNNMIDEIVTDVLKQTGIPADKQAEIFAHMVIHNYFLD